MMQLKDSATNAVREGKNAPTPDPIDIHPKITAARPEPTFHSLENFITATRKLIARRDGRAS
jgi:hypothetical protein